MEPNTFFPPKEVTKDNFYLKKKKSSHLPKKSHQKIRLLLKNIYLHPLNQILIYSSSTELITCTHWQPDQEFVLPKSILTKLNICPFLRGELQNTHNFPGNMLWKLKLHVLWCLMKLRNTRTCTPQGSHLSNTKHPPRNRRACCREQASYVTDNSWKTRTHAHLSFGEVVFVWYQIKPMDK